MLQQDALGWEVTAGIWLPGPDVGLVVAKAETASFWCYLKVKSIKGGQGSSW